MNKFYGTLSSKNFHLLIPLTLYLCFKWTMLSNSQIGLCLQFHWRIHAIFYLNSWKYRISTSPCDMMFCYLPPWENDGRTLYISSISQAMVSNNLNWWKCYQNPGPCVFWSSIDAQNDRETVEFDSNYRPLDFNEWIGYEYQRENGSEKSFRTTVGQLVLIFTINCCMKKFWKIILLNAVLQLNQMIIFLHELLYLVIPMKRYRLICFVANKQAPLLNPFTYVSITGPSRSVH